MSKRTVGKYTLAATVTGIYAAAALSARSEIGKEGTPMTAEKAAKIGAVAALMSGLTWIVASL